METLITIFIIFVIIEFLEAKWQKSDDLNQVLLKNYALYKQYGLPTYLSANMSFFYTMAIAFYLNNFTFWLNMIVVLKFIDISMKLYLFQKECSLQSLVRLKTISRSGNTEALIL